jgi:hypothetical protein
MKKSMKFKMASLLVVLGFSVLPVLAQPGQGRGQGQRRQMSEDDVKRRVEALADTLNLSDKQEKELLAAEMDFYQTMQKERQNFDPETSDREAMRARMMELRDQRDAKYKSTLTSEQYAKYTKIQEARREEMRRRRDQGGSEGDRGRGRGRGGN